MAVSVIPVGTRLTLRVNTGLDENLKPIVRNRSWHRVKPSATNVNLFELGEELGYLQVHTVEAVRRVDENELEED